MIDKTEIKNFIFQLEPSGDTAQERIDFFRQRLLAGLLFSLAVFCTIAYVPSVYYGYRYRFDSIIFMDTLTVGGVYFLLIRKNMRFLPRALGLLAIFYALGVWLLIVLGPTGAGFMWLLLFSIMTGVLFGFTPALVSLGLNMVTVAGLSLLVFKRTITWTLLPENEIAIWAVKSVNFICINAIVAASTGFIIARISRTAEEETQRRIQLDQAIQARIQAEKDNRVLTEQLYQSQKMEAMGTLASGIAHDFNNILGAIKGYTELLRMETDLPGPSLSHIEKINRATDKATGITQQILTFGRQGQSFKMPNDLEEITRECIDLIRIGIPPAILLDLDIEQSPFPVMGDKNQLFQVIMNLLTNGIQAMDSLPDGRQKRLTLALSRMPDTFAREGHHLRPDKRYFMLKVSDTGTGIAEENLSRIFDPYFTTKGSGKGTGLGLSITHGIVKDHNGEIWVDSTPDKGTAFTIVLPACRAASSAHPEADACAIDGNEPSLMAGEASEARKGTPVLSKATDARRMP